MEFNGIDLSGWLSINPTRSFTPTIRDITQTADGRDGAIYVRTVLDPLVIPVFARLQLPGSMSYDDVARVRREIAGCLITDKPAKLVLDDEPALYYMAKLTSAGELSNLWANGYCTLEFTAYDPVAYGREVTVDVGKSTSFNVFGSYPTKPVFDLTMDASTKLRVRNVKTGEFVLTHTSMAAGNHVVIDMAEESTRQNGNLAAVDILSDYFELAPGEVTIEITGATGTCTWQERWV